MAECLADEGGAEDDCDYDGAPSLDEQRRAAPVQQLYQALDKTMELAETHYYGVRLSDTNAGLIPLSEFWCVHLL